MSDERDIEFCSNRQTCKKKLLTVQSIQLTWQRPYNDVACLYTKVADGDVAFTHWQMWTNQFVIRGI